MEQIFVIILAIIIYSCHKTDAKLNGIPSDTEVKVNDSTYLNCSTSLLANQVQWHHGKNYVYTGIAILEPYNARFSVEINASTGACNLVIRSVQPSDAGTYTCADDEGAGDWRSVHLIVLSTDPVCKSNLRSDGVIGPNSCGTEPEEVKLSCSIDFHGDSLPVLQWKANSDNKSIIDGLINVTSIDNKVTYTLTMKSTLGLNKSSFICQSTRTTDKHYSCSSDAINILYVFGSEVTVNMTVNDEVNCVANTSQSCSYKWKWFNGDDSTTESDNQILKPKKSGMHRCEATCSIRNESCSVLSMRATVHLEEATSEQHLMLLFVLLLVPALAVIGVIMYRWRKRRAERRRLDEIEQKREERQRLLGLIATIKTKAAKKECKLITGLTILDKELFVVTENSSEIEVYDSLKLSFSRRWNVKELINPRDLVSCNINKCLYVSDAKGFGQSAEVLKVNPNGKLVKKWPTRYASGTLSVTFESNVILTVCGLNTIEEYSSDGLFIREINLSADKSICYISHSIKLSNGHFVVCHGTGKGHLNRVIVVDADGKPLKTFGGESGSAKEQTYVPTYLFVDSKGFVMVADRGNHRVLLLDSDLKYKRKCLSEEHEIRHLERILLDESNGRLLVVDSDYNLRNRNFENGRILVYILEE